MELENGSYDASPVVRVAPQQTAGPEPSAAEQRTSCVLFAFSGINACWQASAHELPAYCRTARLVPSHHRARHEYGVTGRTTPAAYFALPLGDTLCRGL